MIKKKYILQTKSKGYSGCYAIALLNALIYYDKPYIISLDDPRWEYLVDKYHCRYGGCLDRKNLRKELGNENEVEDRLYEIQYKGYTPVIAHVERYFKDSLDIERIQDFIDNGYLIQVNATSFLGYHGKHAQKFAYQLLNQGLLHVIATDTHRCDGHRSPCLQEVFDLLVKKYRYEDIHTLMYENPLHIINNEEVDPIEGKTSFFKKIFKRR